MRPLGLPAAMQLAAAHLASILAAAEDDGGGGNLLLSLLPFLLIGGVMYMLLIRPQRRRMKEQSALQREIGVGDEVVTTSGIFGFITGEDGPNRFWLQIDDLKDNEPVMIRISRAAVQQKVDTSKEDESATTDADDDDVKDIVDVDPADNSSQHPDVDTSGDETTDDGKP